MQNHILEQSNLKLERAIGIHVRLQQGLADIIHVATQLELTAAQSFLMDETSTYFKFSSTVVNEFVHAKQKLSFLYFVHAAYWSNLANKNSKEFISLCKETEIAQTLASDGIVIHIGATRARLDKKDQARYVAESVNELLHQVPGIVLMLENGPHAGRNFGGDLNDFGLLFELIEQQQRVKFCLDTAHAFVFGYNLINSIQLQDFFKLIDDVIGKDRIGLLHLNDAPERCGSYIDKHAPAGQGLIKQHVLQQIMHHAMFEQVPIILELPGTCLPSDEVAILKQIYSWNLSKGL